MSVTSSAGVISLLAVVAGTTAGPPRSAHPAGAPGPGDDARIARVFSSLVPMVEIRGRPRERFALADRLRHYRTPGASVAVVDGGRLVWTRAFGVRVAGETDPVLPSTPFQAASISKVVTATATLRLVDEGRLALDENVNHYLKSWQVPDGPFTASEKVTLRRILSHSAGLGGHSVAGYAASEALPSLPVILDGEKPAKTAAIRVEAVPGSVSRYSGGGVTIEQLLLTDVTGRAFADLAADLVLRPLHMADSSFVQPLPPALRARAASAHDAAGSVLDDMLYPQAAAAGLWTTPTDLVRWAMAIAEAAAAGSRSERILSRATARAMLAPQKMPFGLGPFLEGDGRAFHFGHEGWNEGFHAEVVYFPATGQGAAVMVNGDAGRPLVREILYAIAAEYRWPALAPTEIKTVDVGEPSAAQLVGVYATSVPFAFSVTITSEQGRLYLDGGKLGGKTELVFTAPDVVVALDTGDRFQVRTDKGGRATSLELGFVTFARTAATSPPR